MDQSKDLRNQSSRHCTITFIASMLTSAKLSKNLIILIKLSLFVNLFNITVPLETKESSSDIDLIEKSANFFPSQNNSGFEEVIRKFNETEDATFFTSVHMPDHVIRHSGNDDEGKNLVILPSDPELKLPFSNVTTFVVLRMIANKSSRYTSHLAYLR